MVGARAFVKRRLRFVCDKAIAIGMETPSNPQSAGNSSRKNDEKALTREERLAAKLRENLRRRKAQARAMDDNSGDSRDNAESHRLPKSPPES